MVLWNNDWFWPRLIVLFFQKYQHVIIVPIGVGWAVSREELQVMAGDRRHYVLVNSFNELANAMFEVLDLVCTW